MTKLDPKKVEAKCKYCGWTGTWDETEAPLRFNINRCPNCHKEGLGILAAVVYTKKE